MVFQTDRLMAGLSGNKIDVDCYHPKAALSENKAAAAAKQQMRVNTDNVKLMIE